MKRAICVLFAVLAIVSLGVGITRASNDEEQIPVQCNAKVCMLPKDSLMRLVASNNFHVDRVAELEEKLKKCKPELKAERNT